MRIVYVITSLGIGGAERQAIALAERMSARGHAVAFLALLPRVAEEWPTSVEVVHLDMDRGPVSLVRGLARARRYILRFRPTLLQSHLFHANIFARILKVIAPVSAVLSTVHNVYEGGWARMLAYRLTDPLCQLTVTVSQSAADRYTRLRAVPRQKCLSVANAIDTEEFAPSIELRCRAREEMDAGANFIWLATSRIVPAKDLPNLLRAFARVRAARSDTRLWIAAGTSGPEFRRVSSLAAELELGQAIRWLGLRRDLPALLASADGFVLSSAWEGMPLALGEAMAMERPVVATDVGGVGELVSDAGFVVPPKNPDALAAAMLGVMRTPVAEREALGRRARQRIQNRFSMDAKADEWERLYREIAGGE